MIDRSRVQYKLISTCNHVKQRQNITLESFDMVHTACLQGVIELLLLQQNIFNYSYSRMRCAIGMSVFGEITGKINAALGKS